MKRPLKILAAVLGGIVLLVVLAAIALPLVVDPNDYKDRIAAAVEKRTGRELSIQGDIGLSVFPWLGLQVGTLELGNAEGFSREVFARTESVRVRVKLLPLVLQRRVVMDTVSVRGLTLNLARNEAGQPNWEDLLPGGAGDGGDGARQADGQGGPPIAGLAVGGLDVREATLRWHDAKSGERYVVTGLSVQSGPVRTNAPVELKLEFDVESGEPPLTGHVKVAGELGVDVTSQTYRVRGLTVDATFEGEALQGGEAPLRLTGDAVLNQAEGTLALQGLRLKSPGVEVAGIKAELDGQAEVSGNLERGTYGVEGLQVRANLFGEAIPGGATEMNVNAGIGVNLGQRSLAVRDLRVHFPAVLGKGYAGNATLAGGVVGDLARRTYVADALTLDAQVFGERVPGGPLSVSLSTGLEVDLGAETLAVDDLRVKAADLEATGRLKVAQFLGSPRFEGSVELAPFELRTLLARLGQLEIRTGDPEALSTASLSAQVQGSAQKVSLESLTLELDRTAVRGTLEVANLAAPAYRFDLTVDRLDADRYLPPAGREAPETTGGSGSQTSGTQNGEGRKAERTSPAAPPVPALPLETLRALDLEGRLRIGALKVAGLALDRVDLQVSAKQGLVRLDPVTARLYGGKHTGSLTLDARSATPQLRLDETLAGVRFGPLTRDLGLDIATLKEAAGDVSVKLRASGDPAKQVYTLSEASLATKLSGASIPGDRLALELGGEAEIDVPQEALSVGALRVKGTDIEGSGKLSVKGFGPEPRYQGELELARIDPRGLLERLGQRVETADPEALRSGALSATFQGSPRSLSLDPLVAKLDETTLGGKLAIPSLEGPTVRFDLALDSIDLDRYLPPSPKGGASAQGRSASPGTAPPGAAAAGLPLEALRTLDLEGRFRARRVKMARITVSNVDFSVKAKDGKLRVNPASANLYGGTYSGNIGVDARGAEPAIAVDEKLNGVQAGPLLQDLRGSAPLTGIADVHLQAEGRGAARERLVRSLNGQGRFLFRNGAVRGVNVGRLIRAAKARLEGRPPPREQGPVETDFTELGGTLQLRDGVAVNEDLVAKSPLLRVTGRGAADLVKELIDYRLTTTVVATAAGQGGPELEELRGVPIPLRVSGPIADPGYRLDVGAIAEAIGRKKITEKVEGKLEKKLGEKLEGQAGEAVRGILKGLFE